MSPRPGDRLDTPREALMLTTVARGQVGVELRGLKAYGCALVSRFPLKVCRPRQALAEQASGVAVSGLVLPARLNPCAY